MNEINVIDFLAYREQREIKVSEIQINTYSDELATAIQSLIQRLRDGEPIKNNRLA